MNPGLERLLTESTTDLFVATRTPVQRVHGHVTPMPTRLVDPNLVACHLELFRRPGDLRTPWGRLLLVSTFDFVAASRPQAHLAHLSPALAGDWIHVRDWCKELTYQLSERISEELASVGLALAPGLPIAIPADAIAGQVATRSCAPLRFAAGRHDVKIWFDADCPPRVEEALTVLGRSRVPPNSKPSARPRSSRDSRSMSVVPRR